MENRNQHAAGVRRRARRRVYVMVNSDIDQTGYMQPRSIIWKDGKIFSIEAVRDFRPASSRLGAELPGGDCYTVVIRGQERLLFFERTDPLFAGRIGRWFVETDLQ